RRPNRLAHRGRADVSFRVLPAPCLGARVHGGSAGGRRSERDRRGTARDSGRRGGPRPPRVGGVLGVPGSLSPCPGGAGGRLPPRPSSTGGPAREAVRHPPLDAAGRAPSRAAPAYSSVARRVPDGETVRVGKRGMPARTRALGVADRVPA